VRSLRSSRRHVRSTRRRGVAATALAAPITPSSLFQQACQNALALLRHPVRCNRPYPTAVLCVLSPLARCVRSALVHGMKVSHMRAPTITMKSEIVLADKATEAKIMAVVAAEPERTKSAAMCSQMATANFERIRKPWTEGGCLPQGPPGTPPTGIGWDVSTEPKNKEDMIALANKLNPVVGFYDPLGIVTDDTAPETIGWFRHAEIKHGRVAMAGFIGYIVHANGIYFPYDIQKTLDFGPGWFATKDLPTVSFGDISAAGSPGDMWDALPTAAKVQIILVVGFLEMHGENSLALEGDGQKHYVRGGKPGYYPSFQGRYPHPVRRSPLRVPSPATAAHT
jgi:hypothetical protein